MRNGSNYRRFFEDRTDRYLNRVCLLFIVMAGVKTVLQALSVAN